VDTLEEVILEAIRQNFEMFALTEHMPRDNPSDLYPEEARSIQVHYADRRAI
jgi:histidinol-phosphatase (PHP family)